MPKMLYLLLAIACSACIALIFKHSEMVGMNRYAVTSANYVTACLVSGSLMAVKGLPLPDEFALVASLGEIGRAVTGKAVGLSPAAGLVWAVLAGMGAGAVFFLGFIYYQIAVHRHGVGLAGAFAKLGILVPMSLSLMLWREYPTAVQWGGIGLAVFSIVLVNPPAKRSLRTALLLLFLFCGAAEFSNKVFQKYGFQEHKSLFLLVTFAVAFLCSLVATVKAHRPVTQRDLLTGIAVGVPNLFSSFFLILALEHIKATVAFPAFGAGTIVIINVVGILFFKERLTRPEQLAVALTITALILINL